jgi:hypothetical protein
LGAKNETRRIADGFSRAEFCGVIGRLRTLISSKRVEGLLASYGSNGAEAMEAPLYEMACEIIGMHAPRYRFFNLLEI